MRYVSVVNVSTGETLAERAQVAETLVSRFIGLQGKRALPESGGLVLLPNNGIHTLFMRMPIDVVFVSQAGKVVHVGQCLYPGGSGLLRPMRSTVLSFQQGERPPPASDMSSESPLGQCLKDLPSLETSQKVHATKVPPAQHFRRICIRSYRQLLAVLDAFDMAPRARSLACRSS